MSCFNQLQLWDTAGEERFRHGGLTSTYFRGAHGALIVFSLTSLESFENVKNLWIDEFYRKRYEEVVIAQFFRLTWPLPFPFQSQLSKHFQKVNPEFAELLQIREGPREN